MNKPYMLLMHHKPYFLTKRPIKKQAGSAIVLAIFVIIIISLLGAALVSLQRDGAKGSNYEVYASRAYLSAYSASELALVALFPLDSTSADTSTCNGADFSVSLNSSSDSGFYGCSASYQCNILPADSATGVPERYKIISTAVCENAQTVTRRQIKVEASSL